jgi:hypothetical protein
LLDKKKPIGKLLKKLKAEKREADTGEREVKERLE